MADELGRVVLDVDVDASGVDKGLRGAEQQTRGFVSRVKSSFGDLKGSLSTGFKQGLGIGAGISAVNMVGDAVKSVAGYVADAVSMAREEEAGIAGLNASLRENAKGWDGTTDAIERTIKAQQDQFAFSDGDQREALSRLVAVTGDVDVAMDRMRLAMDLARLRGIDLATASDIVGKVHGGNIGILSRYGIQLERGATSAEALAKIQEMAAGQAEAFGSSSQGAAESAGMAFEDLQEDIGKKLLPVLTELSRFLRDVLVPALSWLVENVLTPVIDGIGNLADSFREAAGDVHFFAMNFGEQGDAVHKTADEFGITFDELKDRIRDRMLETGESFEDAHKVIVRELEAAGAEAKAASWQMMQDILASVHDGRKPIETDFNGTADFIPQAIKDRWDDVRANAYQQQVEYAKGLLDGQNQVQVAIDATNQIIEEEMTKAEETAYLKGQLASLAEARGLAVQEGKDASVAAIDATTALINQRLAELETSASTAGGTFWSTWASAADRNDWRAVNVVSATAAKIRRLMPSSEPKDPSSPFRGITNAWGFMDVLAAGLERGSDKPAAAVARAFDGIVPAMPTIGALAAVPAMAGVGSTAGVANVGGLASLTQQWILNVEGVPRTVSTKQAAIEELERIGESWG